MEQFSLEKWLQNKSRKIVTRDGREVEIFYYNSDKTLLVGRISPTEIHQYTKDGFQYENDVSSKNDLFFAEEEEKSRSIEIPFGAKDSEFIRDEYCIPEGCEARIERNKVIIEKVQKEEEWTEFEKAIYIDICNIVTACNGNVYGDKELKPIVKGIAKDLLDLARKELESERDRTCEEAVLSQVYGEGYEQGKQDALKYMPKWKKITDETNLSLTISNGGYYLTLEDLESLPKEE